MTMTAVTWRYYRRGPDQYGGTEPRRRYARVHRTDADTPGDGAYLRCGRLVPVAGLDVDEVIVGDAAYNYAAPCAVCHRRPSGAGAREDGTV